MQEETAQTEKADAMIYLKLFLVFAKIGVVGFGGGNAMLPIIYQGARDFGLMSKAEFTNLVAIAQVTPGPIAVNAATYVGYSSAGTGGALAATLGVSLPSFALVILVYNFITKFSSAKLVEGAFEGIRPVTAGLMATAVYFVGGTIFTRPEAFSVAVCALAVLSMAKTKISPLWILLGAGAAGAIFYR